MKSISYQPPISEGHLPFRSWHPTTQLAPGVRGYSYRRGKEIVIPLIVAEIEASGDVGRFLDSLAYCCVITTVTSSRLRGMLMRRGFTMQEVKGIDEWRRK